MSKKVKEKNSQFFIVLLCSSFLLIFAFFVFWFKLDVFSSLGSYQVRAQTADATFVQNVPEIVDILQNRQNPDEQIRATRALALRVGPDEALEDLNNSALPHTGEGHLVIHQVGYVAWEKYGLQALLHCKDYFLYACYHGAIIDAASQGQGFDTIKKMTDQCSANTARYSQCVHAAGHGLTALWNYDVPSALKTCDDLYGNDKIIFGVVTDCHNGVFMENIYGLHDWGKDNPNPVRKWLSSDPYFPCDAMGEKYQEGCWLNQASRMYQLFSGDIAKISSYCDALKMQYALLCFDNLGRQIHPSTAGDPQKVYENCKPVGSKWYGNCIETNAKAYLTIGDPKTAVLVCNGAPASLQNECFSDITPLINQLVEADQKVNMCNLMNQIYVEDCVRQVSS